MPEPKIEVKLTKLHNGEIKGAGRVSQPKTFKTLQNIHSEVKFVDSLLSYFIILTKIVS